MSNVHDIHEAHARNRARKARLYCDWLDIHHPTARPDHMAKALTGKSDRWWHDLAEACNETRVPAEGTRRQIIATFAGRAKRMPVAEPVTINARPVA